VKLEGTTDIFSIRELIEMVTYSTVTGALNIYGGSTAGSIYFRDGRMVHVSCGNAAGLDALTELFIQHGANFTFVSDTRCEEETVWGDAHFLMHSAEQLAARWHIVRPVVPSLELVPRLTRPREQLQRHLLPAENMLLQLIDGTVSLRIISERLQWSPIDVCEVTAELVQAGVIELSGNGSGGNSASHRNGSAAHARPGLFDRVISTTTAGA
jgi:hypothetical protein